MKYIPMEPMWIGSGFATKKKKHNSVEKHPSTVGCLYFIETVENWGYSFLCMVQTAFKGCLTV